MKSESMNLKELVMTALWIAVVTVVTMAVAIPIPMTQGYVNLGDATVYLGVFLLGKKRGAVAAGLGSALADILLAYASFAPFTLVIKGAMAFLFGLFLHLSRGRVSPEAPKVPLWTVVGAVAGTALMTTGYYFAEVLLTGSRQAPIVSIPWNILQGLVGGAIAILLMAAFASFRLPGSGEARQSKVKEAPEETRPPEEVGEPIPLEEARLDPILPSAEGEGEASPLEPLPAELVIPVELELAQIEAELSDDQAAVDAQDLAGDEGGPLPGEEGHS